MLKECPECHIEFDGTKDMKYCGPDCRAKAAARRAAAAREAYRAMDQRMPAGSWSLPYDPWATGQLPAEVRKNALWQ